MPAPGGCLLPGGVPTPGGGVPALGGVPAPRGGVWSQGVPGPGGCLLWGGCLRPGGCLLLGDLLQGDLLPGGAWWRPPTPGTATAAGGAHPTGMHSCLTIDLFLNKNYIHTIRSYSRDCTNRIKDSCFELSLT